MTYIPKDPMCWVQVPRLNQRDWGFRKLFLCKGSPAPNKLIILLTDAPDYEAHLIMWSFTCFIGCLFNTTIADGKIMIWKGEHNCWFHRLEASAKDWGAGGWCHITRWCITTAFCSCSYFQGDLRGCGNDIFTIRDTLVTRFEFAISNDSASQTRWRRCSCDGTILSGNFIYADGQRRLYVQQDRRAHRHIG